MVMDNIARPDIKPAFAARNLPVALATDENYLPYAAVAVNSLVANTKSGNLDIIVLHRGLPDGVREKFKSQIVSKDCVSVRFVDVDKLVGATCLSAFAPKRYLPVEACYRLFLPYLLPKYKKVAYLDVDTVVCHDIGDLLSVNLGNCLFAAAIDIVNSSAKPEYSQWALRHGFDQWSEYVNTGVLVMNLAEFRRADILEPLLNIAVEASRWFCDQDALNFICKGRIARLDPKWNVQVGDYCIRQQLEITKDAAYIYHFTGGKKPWNHPETPYANLWWSCVPCEDGVKMWRKAFGDRPQVSIGDGIAASVIIPVYNAESYLAQALISYCAQTLSNIEIICVDDGSTDGSRAICEKFAAFDPRIRVITQKNQGAAVARNCGIDKARGRWLFFGDADDFCRHDMLEEMVRAGQNGCHDVVVAGRMIIDCRHRLQMREVVVPAGYFGRGQSVNCHTDGINVFAGLGFAPWNKLFRRAFVIEKGIKFHNNPSCDDAFFVFSNLIAAASISFVGKSYYYYRANLPTSQMGLADKNPTNFLVALREVKCLLDSESTRLQEQFYYAAVASCFDHFFARKTSEGRRVTFAALQNGGLESLCFPGIDSRTFDLGSRRRVFDLTVSGGSLADVIDEYYQAKSLAAEKTIEVLQSQIKQKDNKLRAKLEETQIALAIVRERGLAREAELKAKLDEAWADVVDCKTRYLARETELKAKLEEAWAKAADCKARYIARETELKQKLEESWVRNKMLSSDAASTVEKLNKQLELAREKCEAIAADRDRLQCSFDDVMSVVDS